MASLLERVSFTAMQPGLYALFDRLHDFPLDVGRTGR